MSFLFSLNYISWDKSLKFLLIMQKRLFKAILVGDFKIALGLQKLILQSNISRLISIRYVTQVCSNRKLPGIDGKTVLSFVERFELNESLKLNFSKWFPSKLKTLSLLTMDGSLKIEKISTISDRSWQYLIKLAIEPAHEAVFNPRSFGFRSNCNVFDVQDCFSLNLKSESFGYQKRLLILNLENCLDNYDVNFLIDKIITPRSIKLCLNRLIFSGFTLQFSKDNFQNRQLASLLANILLDGIESIHYDCIRFGSEIVYFLKPVENEKLLLQSLVSFFEKRKLNFAKSKFNLYSCFESFDFLYWNFKVTNNKKLVISPSYSNYQKFLLRVKRIINCGLL